jgi:uncharacterized membrane protein
MATQAEARPGPRAAAHTVSGRAQGAVGEGRLSPERVGLIALYVFTAAAVGGYAVFGRDPSRLVGMPSWTVQFYARSFGFFALGHVWLAMAVLTVALWRQAGARWLPAFGVMYGISLASELAGTTWGIPFGAYGYSSLLGPMWLERVPLVIPLSWFFMAVPSYALAAAAGLSRGWRIAAASLVLLGWDLALDPAMSYATRYWLWGESGPYYGMPWLNLFGWYVTGVALAGVLAWLRAEEWTTRIDPRWWVAFYGANLLLPLGMCAAAGLWGAVLATLAVLGAAAWVLLRVARPAGAGLS